MGSPVNASPFLVSMGPYVQAEPVFVFDDGLVIARVVKESVIHRLYKHCWIEGDRVWWDHIDRNDSAAMFVLLDPVTGPGCTKSGNVLDVMGVPIPYVPGRESFTFLTQGLPLQARPFRKLSREKVDPHWFAFIEYLKVLPDGHRWWDHPYMSPPIPSSIVSSQVLKSAEGKLYDSNELVSLMEQLQAELPDVSIQEAERSYVGQRMWGFTWRIPGSSREWTYDVNVNIQVYLRDFTWNFATHGSSNADPYFVAAGSPKGLSGLFSNALTQMTQSNQLEDLPKGHSALKDDLFRELNATLPAIWPQSDFLEFTKHVDK